MSDYSTSPGSDGDGSPKRFRPSQYYGNHSGFQQVTHKTYQSPLEEMYKDQQPQQQSQQESQTKNVEALERVAQQFHTDKSSEKRDVREESGAGKEPLMVDDDEEEAAEVSTNGNSSNHEAQRHSPEKEPRGETTANSIGKNRLSPDVSMLERYEEEIREMEQLLCMVEAQRTSLQRELSEERSKRKSDTTHLLVDKMRLESELKAARSELDASNQHRQALEDENEELGQELLKVCDSVEVLKYQVAASRTESPREGLSPDRGRSRRGSLGFNDSSLPEGAHPNPNGATAASSKSLDSSADAHSARARELRLLQVIDNSSTVFSEIQNKVYTLTHEVEKQKSEIESLTAERNQLMGKLDDSSGLAGLLADCLEENRNTQTLSLQDAEKHSRVFILFQHELYSYQMWGKLQQSLQVTRTGELQQEIDRQQHMLEHAEAQFEHEIQSIREFYEKQLKVERETVDGKVLAERERWQTTIMNMKMDNELLQKNVEEWRVQHTVSLDRHLKMKYDLEKETDLVTQRLRAELSKSESELHSSQNLASVLQHQVERLEREVEELKHEKSVAEKITVALKDKLVGAGNLLQDYESREKKIIEVAKAAQQQVVTLKNAQEKLRAQQQKMINSGSTELMVDDCTLEDSLDPSALNAVAETMQEVQRDIQRNNAEAEDDSRPGNAATPPPFLRQSSTTSTAATPSKKNASAATATTTKEPAAGASPQASTTPSPKTKRELSQVVRNSSANRSSLPQVREEGGGGEDVGDSAAVETLKKEIEFLKGQQRELEQLVVTMEQEKLRRTTQFKVDSEQLRYLCDAAERSKAALESELRKTQEELHAATDANKKLQQQVAEQEKQAQDKELVFAAARQSERECQKQLANMKDFSVKEQEEFNCAIEEMGQELAALSDQLRSTLVDNELLKASTEPLSEALVEAKMGQLLAEERLGRREIQHSATLYFHSFEK